MKVFAALAAAFSREQVESCFALLGDANMHWAGALADLGVKCTYTRHEHAAVGAALAYARVTGKVGVATVTCGPGLTQIMTILPIAVRARIPLIVFAGEAPLNKPWYNQGIDQAPFVQACGATYRPLHNLNTMVEAVHHAFAEAKTKRQPIVLGVPFDLQQQRCEDEPIKPTSHELFVAPDPQGPTTIAIDQATQWIDTAERPIVLAGLGVTTESARLACIALAQRCGACLATSLPAKGMFYDQAFSLGVAGGFATEAAKKIFAESDLIIGIGVRLAAHTFDNGSLTPCARVIHVDIDPQQRVQGREAADLLMTSDAQLGAEALSQATTQKQGWRTPEMESRSADALRLPNAVKTPDDFLHPMAVVKKLATLIPGNCHVVNTSGHSAYYTAQMNTHPHTHYTVIREFGAIGNGTSFAMGIAEAYPNRPIVLIDGDGSAMMNVQELDTMKRHKMLILTIVLNDGAYGSEVHKLRADGVSETGSVFGRPDFAGIARGFGLVGKTITSLETLKSSMDDFLSSGTPTLWDIHISDQVASPQILKAHQQHRIN